MDGCEQLESVFRKALNVSAPSREEEDVCETIAWTDDRLDKGVSMKAITRLAILGISVAAPLVANAQISTYDFSGSVTDSGGVYGGFGIGTYVTGTYTLDLQNANPSQSTGTIGSMNSLWVAKSAGGTAYGGPPPEGFVFSSTVDVGLGSFLFANPPVSRLGTQSYLDNFLFPSMPTSTILAGEASTVQPSVLGALQTLTSYFYYNNPSGAYTENGLLLLPEGGLVPEAGVANGAVQLVQGNTIVGSVSFQIVTLTSAPEPSAASLFLLGCASLLVPAVRRKRISELALHPARR
jgi:hypothetical protein